MTIRRRRAGCWQVVDSGVVMSQHTTALGALLWAAMWAMS